MVADTCWKMPPKDEVEKFKKANPREDKMNAVLINDECVYPFGLDYTWMRSSQEIVYLNNFKMKTSVLYGVA